VTNVEHTYPAPGESRNSRHRSVREISRWRARMLAKSDEFDCPDGLTYRDNKDALFCT